MRTADMSYVWELHPLTAPLCGLCFISHHSQSNCRAQRLALSKFSSTRSVAVHASTWIRRFVLVSTPCGTSWRQFVSSSFALKNRGSIIEFSGICCQPAERQCVKHSVDTFDCYAAWHDWSFHTFISLKLVRFLTHDLSLQQSRALLAVLCDALL